MLRNIFQWKEFEDEKVEIKTKTKYLTDEERRKIIEEEELRKEIRNKKDLSMMDYVYKGVDSIIVMYFIGAVLVIAAGMIIGDQY